MKNRSKSVQINKKILRVTLILITLIIFFSIILFMSTLLPKEKSSLQNVGYSFGSAETHMHRKFKVESEDEGLYNLGEYKVNLTTDRYLTLDLSVKCPQNSFDLLLRNKILIQNAVIETFATYGSIHFPDTPLGKARLKSKIRRKINDTFAQGMIEEVYFNKFLIR